MEKTTADLGGDREESGRLECNDDESYAEYMRSSVPKAGVSIEGDIDSMFVV